MGDENPIRTLRDYSKPSHEGYRNTIELLVGNNVVLLQSNTIRLVQNGCLFYELRFEDPNQHLKDFLKLMDPLDLDGENKERTCLRLFQFSFRDQASNWLERILAGSITIWEDLTTRTLPSDTFKNPKLSTSLVLSARSYPTTDQQCSTHIHGSINAITIHPKQQGESHNDEPDANEEGDKDNPENIQVNPFTNGDSHKEEPDVGEQEVEYFDIFPTRSKLAYHKKLVLRENSDRGISNFTRRVKVMHIFVGNFTFAIDFMIVEDISSVIDLNISQVLLGKPFADISNMTHDPPEEVVRFTNGTDEISYKMPHKIKQYNSLSDLEKEHTKLVYLRNDEDRSREVKYVMSKILRFYKECLELGPEYETGMDDEGKVTKLLIKNGEEIFTDAGDGVRIYPDGVALYLTRRSLEVLRNFHWMILRGRYIQLLHVSSPLLSKPGEY
uniref:MAK10-like protein n=1 Tax=Tanacetum cinerariifolium TaxID=118510 RepID=A0A699GWE9_TANCI|nr:MAK10-like protein [Tanacetum cinerariifolium]